MRVLLKVIWNVLILGVIMYLVIIFCNIKNCIEEEKQLKKEEYDIIREKINDLNNDVLEIEKKVNRIEVKVNIIDKNVDTCKQGIKTLLEFNERAEKNGFFKFNFWNF